MTGWYDQLLALLRDPVLRDGDFALLDASAAGDGATADATSGGAAPDDLVACLRVQGRARRIVLVNYGPAPGRYRVTLPVEHGEGAGMRGRDLLTGATVTIAGDVLEVSLPAWGAQVLAVDPVA